MVASPKLFAQDSLLSEHPRMLFPKVWSGNQPDRGGTCASVCCSGREPGGTSLEKGDLNRRSFPEYNKTVEVRSLRLRPKVHTQTSRLLNTMFLKLRTLDVSLYPLEPRTHTLYDKYTYSIITSNRLSIQTALASNLGSTHFPLGF